MLIESAIVYGVASIGQFTGCKSIGKFLDVCGRIVSGLAMPFPCRAQLMLGSCSVSGSEAYGVASE